MDVRRGYLWIKTENFGVILENMGLKVLDDEGFGTGAALINALTWVNGNRTN